MGAPSPTHHDEDGRPTVADADLPTTTTTEDLYTALMSTEDVSEFLHQTTALAAGTVVPGADLSCGLTMRWDDHPITVASSDARASQVDEVQYELDHGPCLHSLRTGQVVSLPDLADVSGLDGWEDYAVRAVAAGVRASLSLPVETPHVRGAMNLYASKARTFDAGAVDRGTALATEAGRAIALAVRIASQAELTEQLRAALTSRAVIDQAIGVIMGQSRCTAERAFEVLRSASQHRNLKLREVATGVVQSVAGQDGDQK